MNQRTNKVFNYNDVYKNIHNYVMLSDEEFNELYEQHHAECMADFDNTKVYFESDFIKAFFKEKQIVIFQ